MTNKDKNNYLSRMDIVLGDRKKYPFGFSMGFSRGTINRLFSMEMAGNIDTFMAMRHAENLSLDWLLNGIGAPYVTRLTSTDNTTAELITHLFEGEPMDWQATVLTDQITNLVILSQPAIYVVGKRTLDYTRLEVLTGPVGEGTLELLDTAGLTCKVAKTDTLTLRRVLSGQIGTYALLENPGILKNAETRARLSTAQIAEPRARYDSFSTLKEPEILLLQKYRTLSASDQSVLNDICTVLADHTLPKKAQQA